jgi:hypothetical protein
MQAARNCLPLCLQEVLLLMVGSKRTGDDGHEQDTDTASSSLRNSLAVAGQLAKEVDIFKKQQFQTWEVRGLRLGCSVRLCDVLA